MYYSATRSLTNLAGLTRRCKWESNRKPQKDIVYNVWATNPVAEYDSDGKVIRFWSDMTPGFFNWATVEVTYDKDSLQRVTDL
jgi:hypothetical protein